MRPLFPFVWARHDRYDLPVVASSSPHTRLTSFITFYLVILLLHLLLFYSAQCFSSCCWWWFQQRCTIILTVRQQQFIVTSLNITRYPEVSVVVISCSLTQVWSENAFNFMIPWSFLGTTTSTVGYMYQYDIMSLSIPTRCVRTRMILPTTLLFVAVWFIWYLVPQQAAAVKIKQEEQARLLPCCLVVRAVCCTRRRSQ